MERHASDIRSPGSTQGKYPHSDLRPPSSTAGKYFERLTKALPGARTWSGSKARDFWPEGAKFVISISLQFTAGSRARPDESSRLGNKVEGSLVSSDFHEQEYGWTEAIPRLLEIFQRRRVRVTSHMAEDAVELNPRVAKEIVEHGHEAALYAKACSLPAVTKQQERARYESAIRSIHRAVGTKPLGFHAPDSPGTSEFLGTLQELDFLYHVDDVSRDEPFLVTVRSRPFAVVPYTFTMNDRVAYEEWHQSTDQYACELKNEFEMLYTEAENRRRMMSISVHDYISGRPARAKVLEEFIIHAQRRPGVVFLRKDEIARFALASPITPKEEAATSALEAA